MDQGGLAPGTEVGGYRVVAPLGSGGMGTVYRAVDGGGGVVALKLLHPHVGADPAARDRLRREVATLQRLRHPGVAAVLDAEADSSEAFVVTELVDGLTLEEHVRRGGPLPAEELAELADGLRATLDAVHAAGVVHRDLKPSNVMLTARGPVLIDFGIAQSADDAALTSTGFVLGTPGYLAPELLADAEPGPGTDWWGWAAVLAFAATGRPPFGSRPLDAVLARTRAGDLDLAGLDPAVAAPLRSALQPDPRRRATPHDVVVGLDAAVAGVPPAPPTQAVTRATAVLSTPGPVEPDPGVPMSDDTRTRMLARDGRTQAMPAVVPAAGAAQAWGPPGGEDPARDTPASSWTGPAADRRTGGPADGVVGDDGEWDDGQGDDGARGPDVEGWDEDGADAPPWVPPRPRRRVGSVLSLGVLAVVASMLYPGATVLGVLAALVLVRTVGSAGDALDRRRARRGGPARGDAVRAAAASPWYLLRALVGLLPSLVVAVSVVLVVGAVLWWTLETGRFVVSPAGTSPDGGNGPLAFSGAVGATVLLALLAVWFGPLTRQTREGARRTLAAVAPGWSGAAVLVTVALAGTGVLLVLLLTGQPVTWWPLAGPPDLARP